MRKAVVTLLALVGLSSNAYAQWFPETELLTDCTRAVGEWKNEISVHVTLIIAPSCTFSGVAQARGLAVLKLGSKPYQFSGFGEFTDGNLRLPIGGASDAVSHLLLRRRHHKLSGMITIKNEGTFVIELNPVIRSPNKLQ